MSPEPLPLPPLAALLATAEARLRRQRGWARPLTGRGAARLEAALEAARGALAGVAAPGVLWRPLTAQLEGATVWLEGVALDQPRLSALLAEGATVALSLVTLGEDRAALDAHLGDDMLAGHAAGALAVQTLYAAARAAQAELAARHPGRRLQRFALRGPDGMWDAAAVAALLPLLGPAPLGVTRLEGGSLSPAHTLLTLTLAHPG
jgi:hypothetical protein